MPKSTATEVQIPTDYATHELSEVHPSIRYNFGDALVSETCYMPAMSIITTSRDNSYTRPTRGNYAQNIGTCTITINCCQLSSTKQCRDGGWRKRPYYPLTPTTVDNPPRSHLMMIFESTRLYCIIHVHLWGNCILRTISGCRDPLDNESVLTEKLLKLNSHENQYIVIGYLMSAYHFDDDPPQ
jgi:hypothetical protein